MLHDSLTTPKPLRPAGRLYFQTSHIKRRFNILSLYSSFVAVLSYVAVERAGALGLVIISGYGQWHDPPQLCLLPTPVHAYPPSRPACDRPSPRPGAAHTTRVPLPCLLPAQARRCLSPQLPFLYYAWCPPAAATIPGPLTLLALRSFVFYRVLQWMHTTPAMLYQVGLLSGMSPPEMRSLLTLNMVRY